MEKGAPAMTIFLALMLFAAGCSVMSAEEIITKSNDASLKADSYTLELVTEINTEILAANNVPRGNMSAKVTKKMQVDKKRKKAFSVHNYKFLQTEIPDEPEIMYMIENTLYIKNAAGWRKSESTSYTWERFVNGEQMVSNAMTSIDTSNVKLKGIEKFEGREHYVVTIEPDMEKIRDSYRDPYGNETGTFSSTIWVDKETLLISKSKTMVTSIGKGAFGDENMWNVSIIEQAKFYDYNKPVNIELPEEAKAAP